MKFWTYGNCEWLLQIFISKTMVNNIETNMAQLSKDEKYEQSAADLKQMTAWWRKLPKNEKVKLE